MAVDVAATRRRFTRKEYHRMAEVGILRTRDRVELIRGEIVEMTPIGPRHSAFVNNLNRLLSRRLPEHVTVSVQNPLPLSDDNEPQPDVVVLDDRLVPYKNREPSVEDALLVIEVAETSLAFDRSTKARLYAEAGIPEYWVVDCAAETIEIHRGPTDAGYRDVRLVLGTATVSPQAFPDVELTTTEIFA